MSRASSDRAYSELVTVASTKWLSDVDGSQLKKRRFKDTRLMPGAIVYVFSL
jgi:hypothetical protein